MGTLKQSQGINSRILMQLEHGSLGRPVSVNSYVEAALYNFNRWSIPHPSLDENDSKEAEARSDSLIHGVYLQDS